MDFPCRLKGLGEMKVDYAEIEKTLKSLTASPDRLKALSKGLDKTQLHFRSAEEPWSFNDILAHLRGCADVWGKSILAMISQEHPTLRYVSPRTWMRKTNYPEQDFDISLEAFTKQHNELLEALKALTNNDWSRGATFTATTKGREQTVLSYAQRIAQHENEHCIQIEALLKEIR
jgi:DinB family protein